MHKKNIAVTLLTFSFIIGIVLWGRTQPTDAVVVQQPHQSQPAAPRSEELPDLDGQQ
ncbi:MAG TPA: hypothetical protein VJU84_09650 [Pyrinomonadaceae bacterium]|nr:hypothetical protein [Pyrinomonadaceae bacterium]